MRKINIFGKQISVVLVIAIVFMVGVVGAAVVTYHYATVGGEVRVEEPRIITYPDDHIIIPLNASSLETREITITTNRDKIVHIAVLPGDMTTLGTWGSDLIVFPFNDTVSLTAGVAHIETILLRASKDLPAGVYHIRIEIAD